jgi:hypothetical protein
VRYLARKNNHKRFFLPSQYSIIWKFIARKNQRNLLKCAHKAKNKISKKKVSSMGWEFFPRI